MLLCAFLTAGCSRHPELPGSVADVADFETGRRTCDLLIAKEIELALNEPVEGVARPQTRPVLAGMRMCKVDTPRGAAVSWGVLRKGAERSFEKYARWNDEYLQRVKGLGSEAVWDPGLATLTVRQGQIAIGVRLLVKTPPVAGAERSTYEQKTAEALAERALKRLRR